MKVAVGDTGVTLETMFLEAQTSGVKATANRYGMPHQRLSAWFRQSGLVAGGNRDPSLEEIRQAVREIQDSWTPEQARARWVGMRVNPTDY